MDPSIFLSTDTSSLQPQPVTFHSEVQGTQVLFKGKTEAVCSLHAETVDAVAWALGARSEFCGYSNHHGFSLEGCVRGCWKAGPSLEAEPDASGSGSFRRTCFAGSPSLQRQESLSENTSFIFRLLHLWNLSVTLLNCHESLSWPTADLLMSWQDPLSIIVFEV